MKVRYFQGLRHPLALIEDEGREPRITICVPYVPTPDGAVSRMLTLAAVTPEDVLYDLGCGDGRIVIQAAGSCGAQAVGVDLDASLLGQASENARKQGVNGLVRFEQLDLFDADLREASVVTLFLNPEINLNLRPKLLRELRPGARVVSRRFDMGDWKPDKEEIVGRDSIYLWVR